MQNIINKNARFNSLLNVETFFCLFILFLIAAKELYGFQHYLDISFFDESEYIRKGVQLRQHIFNDWGPSYNLWYFFLFQLTKDATTVFYLNYAILIISVPSILFLLLVRFKIQRSLALLMCLSLLMHPILLNSFTYVSHFCLLIILLGFLISTYAKHDESKFIIILTALYVCMYARQEFLLPLITVFISWIVFVLRQKKIRPDYSYLLFICIVFSLYFIFGFISFKAQGIDRSYFAFMQHFAANYMFWTKKPISIDEFKQLDIFNGANTMFQCLINNPLVFLKHIGTNILNYCINIFVHLERLIFPQPIFHFLGKLKHILFILSILYLFKILIKNRKWVNIKIFILEYKILSLMIGMVFFWSFFSIFFVYSEKHYVVLQMCWWILLLCLILNNHIKLFYNKIFLLFVLITIMWLVPTAKNIGFFHRAIADVDKQPNLKTIQYLKNNLSTKTENILTTELGFNAYLPDNYKETLTPSDDLKKYIHDSCIDLRKYLIDKHISIIFVNERMVFIANLGPGNEGKELLEHPENFGFRKQIIDPTLKTYLMLKINP